MINKQFEVYKLKRELKRSGTEYEFKRKGTNSFGEPVKEPVIVGTIKGLYHEQSSYVQTTIGDSAETRTKKVPMILCLYSDVALLGLLPNDFAEFGGKTYKVNGVNDIQDWNLISDISLEVVDNGL